MSSRWQTVDRFGFWPLQIVQIPRHPGVRELRRPFIEFRIVCGNHSPLTGRDMLRLLHGETSNIANGADLVSLVVGIVGLRTVLHNLQIVFPGDSHNLVHHRRLTVQMDDHHSACPRRDARFNPFSGNNLCSRVHVRKYRNAADCNDWEGYENRCNSRTDYFVAHVQVQTSVSCCIGTGPRVYGVDIFPTKMFSECFLKSRNEIASSPPPCVLTFNDFS